MAFSPVYEFDVVPLTRVDSCHSSAGKRRCPIRSTRTRLRSIRALPCRWTRDGSRCTICVDRRSRLIGRRSAGAKTDY